MIPSLLVGIGMLLVSMLSYGVATTLLVQMFVVLIRKGRAGMGFWKNVLVMMAVTLITRRNASDPDRPVGFDFSGMRPPMFDL